MIKTLVRFSVGMVIAGSAMGLGVASTAGAAGNPGATGTAVPISSVTMSGAYPSGVGPSYGVMHCKTFTDTTYKWGVTVCIDLRSATYMYWFAGETYGPSFTGHQHISGAGFTENWPRTGTVTYTAGYGYPTTLFHHFGTHVFCDTLWRSNGHGGFADMGSVCT